MKTLCIIIKHKKLNKGNNQKVIEHLKLIDTATARIKLLWRSKLIPNREYKSKIEDRNTS